MRRSRSAAAVSSTAGGAPNASGPATAVTRIKHTMAIAAVSPVAMATPLWSVTDATIMPAIAATHTTRTQRRIHRGDTDRTYLPASVIGPSTTTVSEAMPEPSKPFSDVPEQGADPVDWDPQQRRFVSQPEREAAVGQRPLPGVAPPTESVAAPPTDSEVAAEPGRDH